MNKKSAFTVQVKLLLKQAYTMVNSAINVQTVNENSLEENESIHKKYGKNIPKGNKLTSS
jgi:hypothetical protein